VDSITAQLHELVDRRELEGPCPLTAARPTVAQALRSALPGDVVPARDRGRLMAVAVLADGRAFAVEDRCPHDGGLLSDGFVEGERIVCARHGWEIDPCGRRCDQRPRELIDARELRRAR
jgi:nitrite reductase/ring-hydroxylating ferredoxin subunit